MRCPPTAPNNPPKRRETDTLAPPAAGLPKTRKAAARPRSWRHFFSVSEESRTSAVLGITTLAAFALWLGLALIVQPDQAGRYQVLKTAHWFLSRAGFAAALVMLGFAVRIGLFLRGDVTPWFRAATYTIVVFMLVQGALGGLLYLIGGRPGQDVHLIYGYGVVLSLPFFIFVEVTAKKRPAMGSYIWGFTLLAAIIVRTMSTGPLG